jgi:uncharacterized lipoprotein YehR (DUF1307 family)
MKKILLLVLIIMITLVGCKQLVPDDSPAKIEGMKELKKITGEEPVVKKVIPKVQLKVEVKSIECTHNGNCTGKQYCISGECKLISDFYQKSDCTEKCNYQKIKITTSDGEKYTLSRGQGSYTAASALEWTIVSGPDYCSGETIRVPFKILKRNYGKVFADEVVILKVGETSKTIGHPLMPEIAFTLRVESVDESCEG